MRGKSKKIKLVIKKEKTLKSFSSNDKLHDMFMRQIKFQKELTGRDTPLDDIELFKQQIIQLISELGEVLKEDKRWKNNRDTTYLNRDKKLTELVDMWHVLINLTLFSGFDYSDIYLEFILKNKENFKRIQKKADE